MRVTAETKETTRRTILETAEELFRTQGFETTTTRDIAKAAGIATGTLFNYFATKEAIVTMLVTSALEQSAKRNSDQQAESLEEALFAYAASALRLLKPYRTMLAPVLETSLSPLASGLDDGNDLRAQHLERVVELAKQHRLDASLSPVALQMYWTLYLGVLAFWTNDRSPKQEQTLALLDQSLGMFVGWLRNGDGPSK